MFIVGLTGGIASGKSTVSAMLGALGATIVDTDVGAREVVAPGSEGLDAVVDAFGPDVLTRDGQLDRAALREHVFRDSRARARLEALLHPRIADWARERIRQADGPYVVLVIPLLAESSVLQPLLSRVLVVDVPESVQLDRLMRRDGSSREQARAMLAAQASRAERLKLADDVVDNTTDKETLRRRIEALHQRYLSLAANVGDNAGHHP